MKGKVYLVGAGPGDPRLLTLRADELIQKADVVLYDRLVTKRIMSRVPRGTPKVYVGRSIGDHTSHQDSTNHHMLEQAKKHKTVVRLKGGDPIIFGRGGEEAEYLKENGIKYEIVPGVTSGIGSATYAGIPLTHRKFASSVVFAAGHEDPGKESDGVDWKAMAGSVDTIVIMMGVTRIGTICSELIEGGADRGTPVAVIENGTTPQERMITGKLHNIEQLIKSSDIRPPAVIIIGGVVGLSEKIKWR
ncbi:uroporphyrinogen-III methylase [Cenarchaeum symbiosum A]|uniref:uroporphyrinogen-III C-methyltransferase n=1 Tax=Cenarchaeum symbiosum (strain A) TaxID=414004 RepID=A0RXB1_CENSY|nr:uroporphyrinogen-III methylase [Cenarchaeum symbiosum A]